MYFMVFLNFSDLFFEDFFDFFLFLIFFELFGFFLKSLRLLLKVNKVTTGHQKWPKIGQNRIIGSFFCPKGKIIPRRRLA